MRGQCEGAVQLRMVAASGASSAHLANGGGYGIPFPHEPVNGYNFEPSVIVRCYWCLPWQNRHYFQRTGKRQVGRREMLPMRREKPQEFCSVLVGLDRIRSAIVTGGHVGAIAVSRRAIGDSQHTIPGPRRSIHSDF